MCGAPIPAHPACAFPHDMKFLVPDVLKQCGGTPGFVLSGPSPDVTDALEEEGGCLAEQRSRGAAAQSLLRMKKAFVFETGRFTSTIPVPALVVAM